MLNVKAEVTKAMHEQTNSQRVVIGKFLARQYEVGATAQYRGLFGRCKAIGKCGELGAGVAPAFGNAAQTVGKNPEFSAQRGPGVRKMMIYDVGLEGDISLVSMRHIF